jgi:hypothetical protein
LTGSVLFGVSAVGALVLRSGTDVSLVWANIGTFLGAVCFLVGAWLFGWPPRRRTAREEGVRAADPTVARQPDRQ